MPDLEVSAYARLIETSSGKEQGCIRIDLDNGKTMQLSGVTWAIGAILLVTLLVGALRDALQERAGAPERFMSMFLFLQWVASTGLLSHDYPRILVTFTSNFAFSLGLIFIRQVQDSLDSTAANTGANVTNAGVPIVGGALATIQASADNNLLSHFNPSTFKSLASSATLSRLVKRAVSTSDSTSHLTWDSLPFGIPRYEAALNISPANSFLTVLVNFLFLACIFFGFALVTLISFGFWKLYTKRGQHVDATVPSSLPLSLTRAVALRLVRNTSPDDYHLAIR